MKLKEALSRTLLLMRDELSERLSDDELVETLRRTSVVLVADEKNLQSHSAQSAFVTTAMLLARSGHRVYLKAPNVELLNSQPPIQSGKLLDQLVAIGPDLLPDFSFTLDEARVFDLAILFGDTAWRGDAAHGVRLNATSWQAEMTGIEAGRFWSGADWPIGGMGVAALGAAEAFKSAMRRLAFGAQNSMVFTELFGATTQVTVDFAPPATPEPSSLGQIDFVSGGAINSSALYVILRLPGLDSAARIIEHDIVSLSNLNRGMLFLVSMLNQPKANALANSAQKTFAILPAVCRFAPEAYARLGNLTDAVLVGVDDIPARWDVQRAWPKWLGIGATTHFNRMASFHTSDTPCAGCLHPKDDPTDRPIPTVAFVSFWAGLWLATLFVRHLAGNNSVNEQQFYFSPLRPESIWKALVDWRPDCPIICKTHRPIHEKRAS